MFRFTPFVSLAALLLSQAQAAQPLPGSTEAIRQQFAQAAQREGLAPLTFSLRPDSGLNVTGRLAGNPFALRIPPHWNGEALLFAHGYVPPAPPYKEKIPNPAVDPAGGLLNTIYAQGYLTADSAYAKTGYAVKEGVEANKALHDFLRSAGVKRQYISGVSMGGNIVVALAEQYPQDYAGAISFCGVVAGWPQEMKYLLDFRVVYDYFTRATPYALPGGGQALTTRPDLTVQAVQQRAGALFRASLKDRAARHIIAQISAVTGAPADPISFVTPLATGVIGVPDYLATAGGNGYSNAQTRYQGSDDDAALNAGIERIEAAPQAAAYLQAHYAPTGRLPIKLLGIHNTSDPLVPARMQPLYAQAVAQAGIGFSQNLVQQQVNPKPVNLFDIAHSGPAHCYFSPAQVEYAWQELRDWTQAGVRPREGENITHKALHPAPRPERPLRRNPHRPD